MTEKVPEYVPFVNDILSVGDVELLQFERRNIMEIKKKIFTIVFI